jgi:hypothetical protein
MVLSALLPDGRNRNPALPGMWHVSFNPWLNFDISDQQGHLRSKQESGIIDHLKLGHDFTGKPARLSVSTVVVVHLDTGQLKRQKPHAGDQKNHQRHHHLN